MPYVFDPFIKNLVPGSSGGGGGGNVTQLTPDSGSPVTATMGNINVQGYLAGASQVIETYNNGGNFQIASNSFITPYVVDSSTTAGSKGTYQTIQAALNQAVTDGMTYTNQKVIYLRTGIYSENLTIPGGAILVGQNLSNPFGGAITPTQNTTIIGHHTFSGIVVWAANAINFEVTGSNDLFNGGASTIVLGYLKDCTLIQGGSGKVINAMPTSSTMNMTDCYIYFGAGGTQVDTTNMQSMTLANCLFSLTGDFLLGGSTELNFLNCQGITEESGVGVVLGGSGGILFAQKTSFANSGENYNISGSGGEGFVYDCSFYGSTVAAIQSTVGPLNYKNCSFISSIGAPLFEAATVVQQDQILQGNLIPSTLTATDLTMSGFMYYVGVTDTSSSRTINLPDSTTSPPPGAGQIFIIKDESLAAATNNITITTVSTTPLIEGASTAVINTNGGSVVVRYDGTNYFIIEAYNLPGGSGGVAISGDSGTTSSSSTQTIQTNQAGNNCGETMKFTSTGTTTTLNVTDSNDNTMYGQSSGHSGQSGSENVGFGSLSLGSLQNGSQNVAVGRTANYFLTTGSNNTTVGHSACESLVSGSNNISLGVGAASNYNGSESGNINIGTDGTVGESDVTRIGDPGNQTACFIGGINGVTVTGTAVLCSTSGQLGTIASSERYKENIKTITSDISILGLTPVSFNYKVDLSKKTQYGLIAEEVDKKFPYLCFYGETGIPESVKYHELCVFLLAEVQRLNQRLSILEAK
jgi:hypothetical protein